MATHFIKLNRPLLEEFRLFLDQKESKLADQLLLATPMLEGSRMEKIPLHGSGHLRLTQALQILGTRLRGYKEEDLKNEIWQKGVAQANHALWEYTDFLQETIQEFVFQLRQTDLNHWQHNFFVVVASFKELLSHRIEDLVWTYRRLDEFFLSYRARSKKQKYFWNYFGKFFSRFSNILDRSILNRLFRSEELLSIYYKQFSMDYEAFNSMYLNEQEEASKKFQKFFCLYELSQEQKELFLKLYYLINIAKENEKVSALKQRDLTTAIKNLAKPGKVTILFRNYIKELKKRLFEISSEWKKEKDPLLESDLSFLITELTTLADLIQNYREIWLRSGDTPYLRTRWSFTEWIVGPEPRKTRDLKLQMYELSTLNDWYRHLLETIQSDAPIHSDGEKVALFQQMDQTLHEMGQPLSSRNHLARLAEKLIGFIQEADELGGSFGPVEESLDHVFLRALRMDNKYQVLQDFLAFENLYAIHRGFIPPIQNAAHEKRLKLFEQMIHHIQFWLKERQIAENHEHFETEEAAIQEELQKLLARLQSESLSEIQKKEFLAMLLEYRYMFSRFFHSLRSFERDGKEIRIQLGFIDQYLDAIENRLTA